MTQEQPRKINPLDAIVAQFAKEGAAAKAAAPSGVPEGAPQPWQPPKVDEAPVLPTEQTHTLRDHPELVAHVASAAADSSLTLRRLETAQAERALLEQENARLRTENARLREQQTGAAVVTAPQDLEEARKKLDEIHERLAAPDFGAREVKENELSLAQKAAQELAPAWNDIEDALRSAGLTEEAIRFAGSQLVDDERGSLEARKDREYLQSTIDWARRLTDPTHINERAEVMPIEFAEHLRIHANNLRKQGSHFINQQALDRLSELTLRGSMQPDVKGLVTLTIELGGDRAYDYVKTKAVEELLKTFPWKGLHQTLRSDDVGSINIKVKLSEKLPQWIVYPYEVPARTLAVEQSTEKRVEDTDDTNTNRIVSREEFGAIQGRLQQARTEGAKPDNDDEITEERAAEVLERLPTLVRSISDYFCRTQYSNQRPATNSMVLIDLALRLEIVLSGNGEKILDELETFLQAVMDKSSFRDYHVYIERMDREGLLLAFKSWHGALLDRSKLDDPAALAPPL